MAMLKTDRDAVIVRPALPQDAPALTDAMALIDEETDFLGKPGEYRQRWADGLADRLGDMERKASGAYMLAAHGAEIVGFLGAFGGFVERTRGAVYIGHVGLRRA